MSLVKEVNNNTFEAEVTNAPQPVLVDFWAPWCGPCRMMAPVIDELAGQFEGRLKIVKINVDENAETASRYGIMSIPTLILFKEGKQVETFVGFHSKNDLCAKIETCI